MAWCASGEGENGNRQGSTMEKPADEGKKDDDGGGRDPEKKSENNKSMMPKPTGQDADDSQQPASRPARQSLTHYQRTICLAASQCTADSGGALANLQWPIGAHNHHCSVWMWGHLEHRHCHGPEIHQPLHHQSWQARRES